MRKFQLFFLFLLFSPLFLSAQTTTNGGIRVRVVLTQLQEGTDGSDFGNEEMDWQLQTFLAGGITGAQSCYSISGDAGGNNTQYVQNEILFDQYFTCAANVPANLYIEWRAEEDDVDAACSHSGSDDSKTCLQVEAPIIFPIPTNGTPVTVPFTYTSPSDCDNFDAQGEWGIAGYIEITQLPEAWELGPAEIRCVECVVGGPIGGPGSCFYVDIPFEKSSSLVDNTLVIATNGGPTNSGDDPNAGAPGVLTTGTMSFGPYTFNGSYDIDITYPSGDPANATCTREFKGDNVVVCINCPDLATVHVDSDECIGGTVQLSATVDDPVTYIEGIDYFIQWQLDGVDIPGANTWGADGIDNLPLGLGGGDDMSAMTYTHTVGWGTDPGACNFEDQVYTARLYCMTDGTTECGTSSKTNTDIAGACGPYFNYTQGLTCFSVDLSYLPACAIATDFTYEVHVASGDPFGSSWICEAVAEVHTPISSEGPFCYSSLPSSECLFYADNGTPQSTCSGGPGNGTGALSLGPNNYDLGGLNSVTPASGIWEVCVYDVYNDNAAGIEGVVNYTNLDVNYYLPPGCNINPIEESQADAVNQSAIAIATAPLTTATHPEGADLLTGVRVCELPVLATDYRLPVTCENEIEDLCGNLTIRYSLTNPGGGDGDRDIADEYPLEAADLPAPSNGDIVYYAIIVDVNGDNISDCPTCADIRTQFVVSGCCPTILTSTVVGDNCIGNEVTMTATVTPGAVEGIDYWIEWYLNGDPINNPNSASFGADGVYGNGDDPASALTYVHTLNWHTNPGSCDYENQVYTARLYCLNTALLEVGDPAKTNTDVAGSAGAYFNYTQPLTEIPLDLTDPDDFPPCAIATDFTYEVHVASGDPYGFSWICEAIAQVTSPIGTAGPFCQPGITGDPASAAQCALYPGDGEQDGFLNEETCSGGPGNGVGSAVIGPTTFSLGGINSTTPANGIWKAQVYDLYNDNADQIEGVINFVSLEVKYILPPACGINLSNGSIVDAVNLTPMPLASGPLTTADNPNGADLLTGVRICDLPIAETDYFIEKDCSILVEDICGNLSIGYAASAAGPFDYTLEDASSLLSDPPIDGEIWYYEIIVDKNGDLISDCPSCAVVTGSHEINLPTPPACIHYEICQGDADLSLAVACEECPAVAIDCGTDPCTAPATCLGIPEIIAINVGQGNADYEGVGLDACGLGSQTTTGTFNVNVSMPSLPSCATNIGYRLDYTINIYGGSFFGEVGINVSGPLGSLGPFQPSSACSSGTMSGTFASGSGDPSGLWTFNISDGFDDGGIDGNLAVIFNVTYELPTLSPPPPTPPYPASSTWYNSATGTGLLGGGILNPSNTTLPVPFTPAGGGAPTTAVYDENVPGAYTFYAQCECDGCPSVRTPVNVYVYPFEQLVPPAEAILCDDAILDMVSFTPITPPPGTANTYILVNANGTIIQTSTDGIFNTEFDYSPSNCNKTVQTYRVFAVNYALPMDPLSCDDTPDGIANPLPNSPMQLQSLDPASLTTLSAIADLDGDEIGQGACMTLSEPMRLTILPEVYITNLGTTCNPDGTYNIDYKVCNGQGVLIDDYSGYEVLSNAGSIIPPNIQGIGRIEAIPSGINTTINANDNFGLFPCEAGSLIVNAPCCAEAGNVTPPVNQVNSCGTVPACAAGPRP